MEQHTPDRAAEEWRRLGFYCDPPDGTAWRFIGSRLGLMRFAGLLRDYAQDDANADLSEHDHFGPYGWLEIMTWDRPLVDDHAIAGRAIDLQELADIVEEHLLHATPGTRFVIDTEYSEESTRILLFEVKEDDFDPASADRWAR